MLLCLIQIFLLPPCFVGTELLITERLAGTSVPLRERLSWSRRGTRVGLVYRVGITDVGQVSHGAP